MRKQSLQNRNQYVAKITKITLIATRNYSIYLQILLLSDILFGETMILLF